MSQKTKTNRPIPEVEDYAEVIFENFKSNFVHYAQSYEWQSDKNYDCYETIDKFRKFSKGWQKNSLKKRLHISAQIFEWAKIRGVKASTTVGQLICNIIATSPETCDENIRLLINSYLENQKPENCQMASWTKILSVVNPQAFFICDSRVCYALNQLCSKGLQEGILTYSFPCLPSQKSEKFDRQKEHNALKRTFAKSVQDFPNGIEFYFDFYCKLIKNLSHRFADSKLLDSSELKCNLDEQECSAREDDFLNITLPRLIEMALFMYGKQNRLNMN